MCKLIFSDFKHFYIRTAASYIDINFRTSGHIFIHLYMTNVAKGLQVRHEVPKPDIFEQLPRILNKTKKSLCGAVVRPSMRFSN